jgi:carboxyl-terminal processing protease
MAALKLTLICAFLLVALTIAVLPAHAQSYAAPTEGFDREVASEVFGTALAFMAPRILDPVSIPQLTVWGVRGVTAIDPRVVADLRANRLVVLQNQETLLDLPPPAADDAAGWGDAAASIAAAAWSASSITRRAGGQALISSFFDELFNHLDPYSRYVAPTEAEADRSRRSGEAGIGASIVVRDGAVFVGLVQANGPAALAGLKEGERIISIDGVKLDPDDARTVSASLAGPDNSVIRLLLRGRDGRTRSVGVRRSTQPPETVFAQHIGDMLVLRVSSFNRATDERLLHELELGLAASHRPHGLVLDLRGNRGGLLRQAVASTSLLMSSGLVATTAGRDPDANHEFRAEGVDRSNGLPVVVIVDGRSSSAAEVVAAALADDRRAVVVGSSTFGKGLVQTITPLPDGGELFVTWSRILAPLSWPLQGLGVLPQVCTSLGQDVLAHQLNDLMNGLQTMARALALHRHARAPMPVAQLLDIRAACPAAIGRDADMTTARFLIDNQTAYETALLVVP